MKISVMLFPYHGAMDQDLYTPEDLVKTFHDAGAVAIELMKGWNEKSPEKWQRLLNAMKDNDMACSCFDIGLNLVQPDSAERAKVLDDCRRQIEYAHTVLNAANVLIYSSKVADGLSNEHCKKLYGEALGEMAEFASQFGINATIEDFDPQPNFVCSAKSCLEVLEIAGPKAKLCFDTGNFLDAGDNPADIYPHVKDRIAHVHVKEKGRNVAEHKLKIVRAGEGIAQINVIEANLKRDGYEGYLSVEAGSNKLDEAVHDIHYLTSRLAL